MGGPAARPCEAIHGHQNLRSHLCDFYHTETLLRRRCHSYGGGGESGRALGYRNVTSSSPSRSTWRLKFTDASRACTTSRSKVNSYVILATNTQAVRGRRTRVNVTNTLFKIGKVCPDAFSARHISWASHSGNAAAISGSAIVMDPPVSSHKALLPVPRSETLITAIIVTRRQD
jgi:hypothetical protein